MVKNPSTNPEDPVEKRRGRPSGHTPKVTGVVTRMATRIASGTYLTVSLPTEHELAAEMGVSYLTARRAVAQLIANGLLRRAPHGRLELAASAPDQPRHLQIAFVVASWNSFDVLRWHKALGQAVATVTAPARVRPAPSGTHRPGARAVPAPPTMTLSTAAIHDWDDPILAKVLAQADGVVIYPGAWDTAPAAALIAGARARAVAVDRDCSALGLPSLCPVPLTGVDALLDHLWERGHRRIACVGAIPGDDVEAARAARYGAWCAARDLPPLRAGITRAEIHALLSALPRATGHPPAILAIAVAEALLCLRVARDLGLRVPQDVAVVVVNDEGLGDVLVPALTAVAVGDLEADLVQALEWMAGGAYPWGDVRCLRPAVVRVEHRETG